MNASIKAEIVTFPFFSSLQLFDID